VPHYIKIPQWSKEGEYPELPTLLEAIFGRGNDICKKKAVFLSHKRK
jgi:hypothetical protein